jgi:hypothetical protein
MPLKPFNARLSGWTSGSKINSLIRSASVARTFYKIIKIINKYIKVFGFALASLACLHSSIELIISKSALPLPKQCNLATKSHKGNLAPT